jgi:GT2 family glycosyltransferase
VSLDTSIPFTAARARNAGFRRLCELAPALNYVQFVDGDCEVVAGWLATAARFLDEHPQVGAVYGRRRERHPERSVYNMLCDIEWDTPLGEAKSCGGDVMMRVEALSAVNGYRADLIAGEEPELCVRLRAAGWRIWHLADAMTHHDAAIKNFRQWWRRTLRAGYAFAQGADLHGASPERHWVRESRSIWFWACGIPLTIAAAVAAWGPPALSLFAIYPLQVVRLALREGRTPRENWWRAAFLVLGKFPQALGALKFVIDRHCGIRARLIEYK